MAENLLVNGDFETEWADDHEVLILPVDADLDPTGPGYIAERGSIFTPPGWLSWFSHDPDVWDQPEIRDAWIHEDPARVYQGQKAIHLFTFNRKHDAGFLQQVNVGSGTSVRFSARPQAWSNHLDPAHPDWYPHPDDPRWSEGEHVGFGIVAYDEGEGGLDINDSNITFWVGIDPTGGVDPHSPNVIWSGGKHCYNGYVTLREVEAVAENDIVTVFLHSRTIMPFKHNDVYWDDAWLVVLGDVPEPPEPPVEITSPKTWPYPELSGSLFGPHACYSKAVPEIIRAAEAGAPIVAVKAVDDLGWLLDVRAGSPETLLVGRFAHDLDGVPAIHNPDTDLEAYAEQVIGIIIQKAIAIDPELLNEVNWFEVINEPLGAGVPVETYVRLAELMKHCMTIAEREGFRIGIFSFATGNPELEMIEPIINTGVFEQAQKGGHIFCVHEGPAQPGVPIDLGYDYETGAGDLHYRLEHWFKVLHQRGEQVLTLNSEWYGDAYTGEGYDPSVIVERFAWWDEIAGQKWWILAGQPFTFSPTPAWDDAGVDYDPSLSLFVDHVIAMKDRVLPPVPEGDSPDPPDPEPPVDCTQCPGYPREQYSRVYVLLPPLGNEGLVNRIVDASWNTWRYTIGNSADDAGIGALEDRRIIAINPEDWQDDLEGFFEEHYPGADYLPMKGGTEYQLRGRFVAAELLRMGVELLYPTTHTHNVGITASGEFGNLRDGYVHNGLDIRSSWSVWGDEILAAMSGEVIMAGVDPQENWFGYQVKTITELDNEGIITIRYAHLTPDLYVQVGERVQAGQQLGRPDNTGNSTGDHLHIDVKYQQDYVDPEMLIAWPDSNPPDPPDPDPTIIRVGLNDPDEQGGGDWMIANAPFGLLYVPLAIGPHERVLDFTAEFEAGIDVYVNLRFGWSTETGEGTLPRPDQADDFVTACLNTIHNSHGVMGWTIANEMNNPREWPVGHTVTPDYFAEIYNQIYNNTDVTRLSPGAIDPYNGQAGDSRIWFQEMWEAIDGADYIDLHGYIRGPDRTLCWSDDEFQDAPLLGMGLNYLRCCTDLLPYLPGWATNLPFVVSEWNHLYPEVEPEWGWVNDERGREVVLAAYDRALDWNSSNGANQCVGLAMYRWRGDEWEVHDKPQVLTAIAELS